MHEILLILFISEQEVLRSLVGSIKTEVLSNTQEDVCKVKTKMCPFLVLGPERHAPPQFLKRGEASLNPGPSHFSPVVCSTAQREKNLALCICLISMALSS